MNPEPFVERPALRYRLCDVCDRHVPIMEMWQEPCPTAADGILYGHRECVQKERTR